MNATMGQEFHTETLTIGRRSFTRIVRRRWTTAVVGLINGVKVAVYRNQNSKCEECGVNVDCSHVVALWNICTESGVWK